MSRKEFETRLERGNFAFSVMERDPATHEPDFARAVCRYEFHRGGAGMVWAGEEMRTLRAVHETIDYLQADWMTEAMIARCEGSGGYVLVYKVLHDAIKAISSDMAFIRGHYPCSLTVASVFERTLRMAIDAHYRLAEDLTVEQAKGQGPGTTASEWWTPPPPPLPY